MRIVFLGTPTFVDPVLRSLENNFEVVLTIRQPQAFTPEFTSHLKSLNADLFVVGAYGQILPKELIDIPRLGTINIHPSLLPKYRGASPIQSAILSGDAKTGVTFIKMDEQMDHGDIVSQLEEEIKPTDTFESLAVRLFDLAADKLPGLIKNYKGEGKKQNDGDATFTKILKREDGLIDLQAPPDPGQLKRMIRAYHPWPGVWFEYDLNGKKTIIKLLPEEKIQVEGKKPMSYKDFKNGYAQGEKILSALNLLK